MLHIFRSEQNQFFVCYGENGQVVVFRYPSLTDHGSNFERLQLSPQLAGYSEMVRFVVLIAILSEVSSNLP